MKTVNERVFEWFATEWNAPVEETGCAPSRVRRTNREGFANVVWNEAYDTLEYRSPNPKVSTGEVVLFFEQNMSPVPNLAVASIRRRVVRSSR